MWGDLLRYLVRQYCYISIFNDNFGAGINATIEINIQNRWKHLEIVWKFDKCTVHNARTFTFNQIYRTYLQ